MKIAIPVSGGVLADHFGHCEQFALVDTDPVQKTIVNTRTLTAPPHQPGLLPKWLADRGAEVVIAGGMGQRARQIFEDNGITVVIGATVRDPEQIVIAFLNSRLVTGDNICDH